MKKNVSGQSIGAEMITASDGTAFTGTVTVVITVDNGTQSASGGTAPAHEGNGYHSYSPTAGETNGDHIAFTFTGTGAIPATIQVYTTFPQTVDNDVRLAANNTLLLDIPTVSEFNARTIVSANYALEATVGALNNVSTADVNAQCDLALSDYDGPTNAEMIARTLLTASYFDPAADAVANVTLVATTTTNTDMRGTDSANTVAPDNAGITSNGSAIAALNDVAATDIVSSGAITTLTGSVVSVDTVDVTTTNTDMRGTDSAATATALATVDSNVDGIKTKTDQMTYTKANELDGNTLSVNGQTVTGDGGTGTEWQGA